MVRTGVLSLGLWLVSVLGPGCVPYASPPVVMHLGVGGLDQRVGVVDDELKQAGPVPSGRFEVSLRPLAPFDARSMRRFDLGVGYVADLPYWRSAYLHALQLQLEGYPWIAGGVGQARLGPYLGAGPLWSTGPGRDALGFGLDAGAVVEWSFRRDGPRMGTGYRPQHRGVSFGRGGVGFFLGGGLRRVGGETAFALAGGFRLRLPLAAGIAWSALP
ncbi:MAG: hypothetical protein OEZ06_06110 [Myxococcales bacterium]|nr:hypothetical protein [Myxococcales bacterium]